MEIEVVRLSKIEKSTDQGIKDVFAVVLEGDELVGEHHLPVHGRLMFSCETFEPLTKFANMVIGDKRRLTLTPVNSNLSDFAEPDYQVVEDAAPGQTVLETAIPDPEKASAADTEQIKEIVKTLLEFDVQRSGEGALEDHLINNFKKDMLRKIAYGLHLAAPKSDLPQKTAFDIAKHIMAMQAKQAAGNR